MAAIRKHWLAFSQIVLIVLLCIAVVVVFVLTRQTPPAMAQQVGPQAVKDLLDVQTYTQVMQVRQSLALTNADLAAMGCTQQEAEAVLSTLLTWCRNNQQALHDRGAAIRTARQALRATQRAIHVGPRNEAVIASLPGLESSLELARQQQTQLLNSVIPTIEGQLTTQQRNTWFTARANSDAPATLRYAPVLTKQQIDQVYQTARQRRRAARKGNATTSPIDHLGLHQKQAIVLATANRQMHMPDALAADAAILPIPAELLEDQDLPYLAQ